MNINYTDIYECTQDINKELQDRGKKIEFKALDMYNTVTVSTVENNKEKLVLDTTTRREAYYWLTGFMTALKNV